MTTTLPLAAHNSVMATADQTMLLCKFKAMCLAVGTQLDNVKWVGYPKVSNRNM